MMQTIHAAEPQDMHLLRRGIMLAILFTLLLLGIFFLGAARLLNDSSSPVQQSTNSASQGATKSTEAPIANTNTPSDRTVPSRTGGNANTILNAR